MIIDIADTYRIDDNMKPKLISPYIFNNAYCLVNPHNSLSYVDKRRCVEQNFRYFNYPLPKFYLNDIYRYEYAMFDGICEPNIGMINIFNHAKKMDMPYVVYLEEDLCMHKNIDNLLQLYLDAIPADADVVQLGYNNFKFEINAYCKLFYKLQPNEGFAGAQFMIVFKRAYDKLLHLLVEDKLPFDCGIGHLENAYTSNIPLFIQYDIRCNDPGNNFFDIAWGLTNRINYIPKNDNDKSYIMQNYLFNHSDIYDCYPLANDNVFRPVNVQKTISIFAIHSITENDAKIVNDYIQALLDVSYKVIVVSDIPIQDLITTKYEQCNNVTFLQFQHNGYDFYSYKIGFNYVKNSIGLNGVSLIFCNDSCYGPFFPLDKIISNMTNYDFWGITSNTAYQHHIQSYFYFFCNNVITSNEFNDFIDSIRYVNTKEYCIQNYEIVLTKTLENAKFTWNSFIPNDQAASVQFPDKYIDQLPFQKKSIINCNLSKQLFDQICESIDRSDNINLDQIPIMQANFKINHQT